MLESALFNSIPLCTLDIEIDVTMRVSAISVANFDTLLSPKFNSGKRFPPNCWFSLVSVSIHACWYDIRTSLQNHSLTTTFPVHKYLKLTGVQTCIRESRTSNKYVTKLTLSFCYPTLQKLVFHIAF